MLDTSWNLMLQCEEFLESEEMRRGKEKREADRREEETSNRREKAKNLKKECLKKRECEKKQAILTDLLLSLPPGEEEKVRREEKKAERLNLSRIQGEMWKRWRGKGQKKLKDKIPGP